MNFMKFLRDKIIFLIIKLFALIFISALLLVTKTNTYAVFFTIVTLILICIMGLCYEYFSKHSFYKRNNFV